LNPTVECPLCHSSNHQSFLVGRPDYEFGLGIHLTYSRSLGRECGLVFAHPLPSAETIGRFYDNYTTRERPRASRLAALLESAARRAALKEVQELLERDGAHELTVLDYGCGSGIFMEQLRSLGVGMVAGYDLDRAACAHARSRGLGAFSSEEEVAARAPFDYIFLNHVIEHLASPADDLRRIVGYLKPGGKLVLRTPNSRSLLSRLFGKDWRGWETPRHLHLFNAQSIQRLLAETAPCDARLVKVATSNAMFVGMFLESFHSPFWRMTVPGKVLRHLCAQLLAPLAHLLNAVAGGNLGEEIYMVAEKHAQP
jgi:2-polyprenyl-3-methyl-5-hydroxy-6-metoxy-1,4-benzoquinol methylase